MIGPSHGIGGVAIHRIFTQGGALVDQHDLDPDALLAQLLRLRPDGFDRGQELQPGCGAGADQFGGLLQLDADDANAQVAVIEDVRALHPVRVQQR